jgi:hypothetical protein
VGFEFASLTYNEREFYPQVRKNGDNQHPHQHSRSRQFIQYNQ